ncbi:MAG: YbaB/EbfC family nucleoid-associated protein [Gammaproteobacteria bacterium]|nr:MAG: YbaB/EbfC family nucleoid-associated protein [Gammaproteobacteria bacterium]
MKADLGQIMKQAQKMQAEMQKAQAELAGQEVEGQAGGGLVRLTMNCAHEVRRIEIDDSLLGEDRDMLEDMLAAAFNDALRKVQATVQERMAGLAGGLGLPGGLPLPL